MKLPFYFFYETISKFLERKDGIDLGIVAMKAMEDERYLPLFKDVFNNSVRCLSI